MTPGKPEKNRLSSESPPERATIVCADAGRTTAATSTAASSPRAIDRRTTASL